MREVLLVRFGEIYLKGLNRPYFMRMLVERVKKAVACVGGHVWLSDSRVYVSDASDMDLALAHVCKVFGVHSVCRAVEMDKADFSAIREQAVEMLSGVSGSFKVDARRSDKRYPMDSPTLNMEIGGYVLERLPQLRVDVHHPETVLSVEIRDHAYLYTKPVMAVGGMPVGTNGRALLLLSGRCVKGHKSAGTMTVADALAVGVTQAIAPLPSAKKNSSNRLTSLIFSPIRPR